MSTATVTDLQAPHGRDEDGVPLAPYGHKKDGTPRQSNRGARPGESRSSGGSRRPPGTPRRGRPGTRVANRTDQQRHAALVGLADMLIVTPLAGLSSSPQLATRFGVKQTDALAGDAVIVSTFMPAVAESLIVLSQTKPGALAWLDTVEEKAPYLMLMQVGMQMTKAIVENHLNPSTELAKSGRLQSQMKLEQMAQMIQAEAAAMGIPTEVASPPSPNGQEDYEPTVEFSQNGVTP